MATIISDEHHFVFVHIPKCAGQTVSTQLIEAGVDWDKNYNSYPLFEHAVKGQFMMAHLPLPVLSELFPKTLVKYQNYHTFAVAREPRARFASAMAQHLREFHDVDLHSISEKAIARKVDEIMKQMANTPVWTPVEYIHFTRQSDYVYLDGKRIISDLYTTDSLPEFYYMLGVRYGLELNPTFATNTTTTYRVPALKRTFQKASASCRKVLPSQAFNALRVKARAVAIVQTKGKMPDIFWSDTVNSFLQDFYAADYLLWRELQADIAVQQAAE